MKNKILAFIGAFIVLSLPYIAISQITQQEAQQIAKIGVEMATQNNVQLLPFVNNDLLGTLITVLLGIIYRAIEARKIKKYYRRKIEQLKNGSTDTN